MNTKEITAKSIEEAKKIALEEFNVSEDQLDIAIIEKESKGLLGIFGGKDAKIRVTLKEEASETKEEVKTEVEEVIVKEEIKEMELEDPQEVAKRLLSKILDKIYINCDIVTELKDGVLEIELTGENMALAIGKRGKTLDALGYLTSIVVNKDRVDFIPVRIDTQNYRKKREEALVKLAHNMASKAKKLRKDIILDPMNSYERRIIHTALQNDKYVKTRSEGTEPNRKVIIFLNR